ncbi:MAG: spore coat protein [bacterium]|nr:spore coat protein [bacterium]
MQPNLSGRNLSDRTIAMDSLNSCKHLSHLYHMATEEASDPSLRRTLDHLMRSTLDMGEDVFRLSHRHGWYQVAHAEPGQVGQFLDHHHPIHRGQHGHERFGDVRQGERIGPDVGGFPYATATGYGVPVRAEGFGGRREEHVGWGPRQY